MGRRREDCHGCGNSWGEQSSPGDRDRPKIRPIVLRRFLYYKYPQLPIPESAHPGSELGKKYDTSHARVGGRTQPRTFFTRGLLTASARCSDRRRWWSRVLGVRALRSGLVMPPHCEGSAMGSVSAMGSGAAARDGRRPGDGRRGLCRQLMRFATVAAALRSRQTVSTGQSSVSQEIVARLTSASSSQT